MPKAWVGTGLAATAVAAKAPSKARLSTHVAVMFRIFYALSRRLPVTAVVAVFV
jgi:hypothetical protein